jgi:hypothetical protein
MGDKTSSSGSPKVICGKRTRSEDETETTISTGNICVGTNSSSSSSSSASRNQKCDKGSNLLTNSLSDISWKTMYEDEHTKNTMLNLQLCFVQSECMRLLNLQSDMAGSIATLQV